MFPKTKIFDINAASPTNVEWFDFGWRQEGLRPYNEKILVFNLNLCVSLDCKKTRPSVVPRWWVVCPDEDATNVVTPLPGQRRRGAARYRTLLPPSYSITTRRTCPASGRTGRGRQMRQQLHREPRTGLARTPQTSLSCCWWPVGGGPRKPIMKCYRRRGAAGRVATSKRLLNLSSLYSLGVLKPPLITPWTTNKSSTIF